MTFEVFGLHRLLTAETAEALFTAFPPATAPVCPSLGCFEGPRVAPLVPPMHCPGTAALVREALTVATRRGGSGSGAVMHGGGSATASGNGNGTIAGSVEGKPSEGFLGVDMESLTAHLGKGHQSWPGVCVSGGEDILAVTLPKVRHAVMTAMVCRCL